MHCELSPWPVTPSYSGGFTTNNKAISAIASQLWCIEPEKNFHLPIVETDQL
jgi:hypothetical protein